MYIYDNILSHWIILKMRNISDKYCRENQNTYFMFNNVFPKIVSYKIMRKNAVEPDRPQMTL
jgi:hypothetical protein